MISTAIAPTTPAPTTPAPAAVLSDSAQQAAYDALLVERCKAGDDSAFAEIMNRYWGTILNVAQRLLRNRADAEDITQDTFIRAHRALPRFRGDSSLITWLHRIATNLCHNRYWYFYRRHHHDSLSLDQPVGEGGGAVISDLIATEARDPAQQTVYGEFSTLIAACMEKLDPKHREILTLRNIRNLRYDEISRILGISVGTVKSQIARARQNLRTLLGEMCPEFRATTNGSNYFLSCRMDAARALLCVDGGIMPG